MRLFAISDLHLSFSTDKKMDVFAGWANYTARLFENWQKVVGKDDTVVIAGDVSWGISLEEALEDFRFLDSLNGKKIILKGNHDYWWSTASKIKSFLIENDLQTINLLHNNCFTDGKFAVCGTRGWVYDGRSENDIKVISRECGRLEKSLDDAASSGCKPIVFLHYPPVYGDYVCDEIITVLKRYGIKKLYYGHIHGSGSFNAPQKFEGIAFKLLSADSLRFTPAMICKCGNFE